MSTPCGNAPKARFNCLSEADANFFRSNPHARFYARRWCVEDARTEHDLANALEPGWMTIVLRDGRRYSTIAPIFRGPHWKQRAFRWAESVFLSFEHELPSSGTTNA